MVVVMTNFNGFGGGCGTSSWETDYDQNLVDAVIPYVQAHFDVSSSASERAFSGLSCGGDLTTTLMANYTSEFGYYGAMSPAPNTLTAPLSPTLAASIATTGVLVGGGWQDPIHSFALTDLSALQQAGDGVLPDFVNGGHEWYVWRILRDFLTRVAFLPVTG